MKGLRRRCFDQHFRAQIRDARRAALVGHGERHGIIEPIVRAAVGIVRYQSDRVRLRAEIAKELEHHGYRIAALARPDRDVLQIRIGAVDLESDPRADQHADYGFAHIFVKADRGAHADVFSTPPNNGWLAVGTQRFDFYHFRTSVAAAGLGMGRRALDEILALATTRVRMAGFATIGTEQLFQFEFAKHELAMLAASPLVYESLADADAEARHLGPGMVLPTRVRAAATYATHVATDAARFAYHWAGSAGLRPGVIQRCLRDLLTGSQHIYVDNNTLTGYTQSLLAGVTP